jgi:hypothetical protein
MTETTKIPLIVSMSPRYDFFSEGMLTQNTYNDTKEIGKNPVVNARRGVATQPLAYPAQHPLNQTGYVHTSNYVAAPYVSGALPSLLSFSSGYFAAAQGDIYSANNIGPQTLAGSYPIALTLGATSGASVSVSSASGMFSASMIGQTITARDNNLFVPGTSLGQATITAYINSTTVTVNITTPFSSTSVPAYTYYISPPTTPVSYVGTCGGSYAATSNGATPSVLSFATAKQSMVGGVVYGTGVPSGTFVVSGVETVSITVNTTIPAGAVTVLIGVSTVSYTMCETVNNGNIYFPVGPTLYGNNVYGQIYNKAYYGTTSAIGNGLLFQNVTVPTTANLVGRAEFLDGYIFILDSIGRIWNSDINVLNSWNGLNFIQTNSNNDAVSIAQLANNIIAFSISSFQVYYNAGNVTGSPLAENQTAARSIGCLNWKSIAIAEEVMYWVGMNESGRIGVYKMGSDFNYVKLSTPGIDRLLEDYTEFPDSVGKIVQMDGHVFYVLDMQNGAQLVYDIEEGSWHKWDYNESDGLAGWMLLINSYENMPTYIGAATSQSNFPGSFINGPMYCSSVRETYYNDFCFTENIPTIRVTTDILNLGTGKRKYYKGARLLGGQTQNDGYSYGITWIDKSFSSGAGGPTNKYTGLLSHDMSSYSRYMMGMGSSVNRSWRIYIYPWLPNAASFGTSYNYPCRLEMLEVEIEVESD